MWSWLLPSVSIFIITIIELVRKQKWLIKGLFIILCLLGLVGAYMAYRDNQRFSEQLGQITSVEGKVDSLLIVRDNLASEVANLRHGIDTLLARRDSIDVQIRTLCTQQDSLMSVNDSLMKIGQTQLRGQLEAIWGESKLGETSQYERTDRFRSRWPQDLQDVSISLRFDHQYVRVKIDQRPSGGLLNVTCPSVDTITSSDNLLYRCHFLEKGNSIEVKTYSRVPLRVVASDLRPR